MRKLLPLLLALASTAFAEGVSAPAVAAGGWKEDMRAEFAAWHAAPAAVDLAQFKDRLPLGVRVDLALRPYAELKLLVAPRRAPAPDSFGGMPEFEVPADGPYRVSAGTPVWIDVVETATGKGVASSGHDMQPKSEIRKCVVFPLRAGVRYALQVSGSKAAAASILITPAPAPEIRLPVLSSGAMRKVGGYMPQRLALSAEKPPGLTKLPPGLAAPVFGTLKLGPADAPTSFLVVLDEPEGKPARLFVDTNANGDLTDDPAPDWSPREAKGADGTVHPQYMGEAGFDVTLDGKPEVLRVGFFLPAKRDPAQASTALFYHSEYAREGQVELGGRTYTALLADLLATGDFRGRSGGKSSGVQLMIDINGNGTYEPNGEAFDIREPFTIGGTTYEVAGMTAGGSFRIVKSARTVPEKPIVLKRRRVAAAAPAPAFKAVTTGGAAIDFPAGYKGRVVLLDFWATWCGPCLAEMPNVVAAYEKFHDRGFEVLGVSLDHAGNGPKLAEVTQKKRMAWPEIYDGKYNQAAVAVLYNVSLIPNSFLVDGDTGLILAVGLRGDALTKAVESALAAKGGK